MASIEEYAYSLCSRFDGHTNIFRKEELTMGNGTVKDERLKHKPRSGVLIPFEEKLKEYEKLTGDQDVMRKAWENIEVYANRFVWMVLTDI